MTRIIRLSPNYQLGTVIGSAGPSMPGTIRASLFAAVRFSATNSPAFVVQPNHMLVADIDLRLKSLVQENDSRCLAATRHPASHAHFVTVTE
jgi:hypothetical protein